MNIFLDLGAHNGETARLAYDYFPLFTGKRLDKIYAFEPDPRQQRALEGLEKQIPGFVYINKAVWIKDGQVKFTMADHSEGSTLAEKKSSWGKGKYIDVECIDFAKWLKKYTSPGNTYIIKMDIEGAEYQLLEHIAGSPVQYIDKIAVEWHDRKMGGDEWLLRHQILLKQYGDRLTDWEAYV